MIHGFEFLDLNFRDAEFEGMHQVFGRLSLTYKAQNKTCYQQLSLNPDRIKYLPAGIGSMGKSYGAKGLNDENVLSSKTTASVVFLQAPQNMCLHSSDSAL